VVALFQKVVHRPVWTAGKGSQPLSFFSTESLSHAKCASRQLEVFSGPSARKPNQIERKALPRTKPRNSSASIVVLLSVSCKAKAVCTWLGLP
jgi:hypothetical protein